MRASTPLLLSLTLLLAACGDDITPAEFEASCIDSFIEFAMQDGVEANLSEQVTMESALHHQHEGGTNFCRVFIYSDNTCRAYGAEGRDIERGRWIQEAPESDPCEGADTLTPFSLE